MPANLYGPNDNFDLQTAHVLPALIRRAHDARTSGAACLRVWGTGTPRREFLHVDDCADALIFLLKHYDGGPINLGSGTDISVGDLAQRICSAVGFGGEIGFDPSMPDGTPRKLLRSDRIAALGWAPRIGLDTGIRQTYQWFLHNVAEPPVPA